MRPDILYIVRPGLFSHNVEWFQKLGSHNVEWFRVSSPRPSKVFSQRPSEKYEKSRWNQKFDPILATRQTSYKPTLVYTYSMIRLNNSEPIQNHRPPKMAMHRPATPKRPGEPTKHNQKRSKELLEQVIAEFADCANVSETARRCGVTPWLMYYWKRRSEDGYPGYTIDMGGLDDEGEALVAEFHEAWDAALEIGNDYLEQEAQRRAVAGYEEPIVHKGIQAFVRDAVTGELELDEHGRPIPLTIRRYSDRLLEVLLKARRPEKFRENMKIEAHVTGGVLAIPQSDQANLTADDWAARFRDNADGKTIDGTPVYPHEMPPNEIDPDTGLEKRTGSTSVRAIMERKMREKAEAQDPELERKTADLLKWQMENKQQNNKPGLKPIQKPELQQSGPRGVEHNMRRLDKLTPEELEDLGFDPLA